MKAGVLNNSGAGTCKDDLARLKKGAEAFRDKMRVLADFPVLMKDYLTDSVQNMDSDAAEVLVTPESGTVIAGLLKELIKLTEDKDFDNTDAFDESLCKQIISGLSEILKIGKHQRENALYADKGGAYRAGAWT